VAQSYSKPAWLVPYMPQAAMPVLSAAMLPVTVWPRTVIWTVPVRVKLVLVNDPVRVPVALAPETDAAAVSVMLVAADRARVSAS